MCKVILQDFIGKWCYVRDNSQHINLDTNEPMEYGKSDPACCSNQPKRKYKIISNPYKRYVADWDRDGEFVNVRSEDGVRLRVLNYLDLINC